MNRIAVSGKARSGKDEFAAVFCQTYPDATVARFASRLYTISAAVQRYFGADIVKDPALMQMLGDLLQRELGEDVFIRPVLADIAAATGPVVVVDMRTTAEHAALTAAGFTTVRIERPGRPIDRDPTHLSETALDNTPTDHIIYNTGSLAEYRENVAAMLLS